MFKDSLPLVSNWKHWRILSATEEDTPIASLIPDNFPTAPDSRILPTKMRPDEALMLRFYGNPTADDTATFRLTGWMKDHAKYSRGAGFVLCEGSIALGTNTVAKEPLEGAGWGDMTWYEVDTMTTTNTNACQATTIQGAANKTTIFVVPTLGFTDITLELSDKDASGTEIGILGVMYRQIPEEMAYRIIEATTAP